MESIRQKQVGELIKRNFGILLQNEGRYIYGAEALVTVTNVIMSPDFNLAKVYLSVYNTENKQEIILLMEHEVHQLRHSLAKRIRRHVRKTPELNFYLDDTLDEMFKIDKLFTRLKDEGQMGEADQDGEDEA